MTAEPPPGTARGRGRGPVLTPSMLRRIRARCVTRARRYHRNHPGFSRRDELYFFFGAMAALDCFPDPAAKALADEWMRDLCGTFARRSPRSPCDQSPAARAARVCEAAEVAESKAALAALDAAFAGKDGAQ